MSYRGVQLLRMRLERVEATMVQSRIPNRTSDSSVLESILQRGKRLIKANRIKLVVGSRSESEM